MEVITEILVDGTISGAKQFSMEIVAAILFAILFWVCPNLRKLFRKKDNTSEMLRQDIAQLKEMLKRQEELSGTTKQQAEEKLRYDETSSSKETGHTKEILRPLELQPLNLPSSTQLQTQRKRQTEQEDILLMTQPRRLLRPPARRISEAEKVREAARQAYINSTRSRRKSSRVFPFLVLAVLLALAFIGLRAFFYDDTRNASGQYELGNKYYKAEDYVEAVKWYTLSAEQGYSYAQYNLGIIYYNGYGVKQDYIEAAKWFWQSAKQGYANAQYNLGVMYFKGEGVKQDYAEARKCYELAAAQGYSPAKEALDRLK